MRNVFLNILGVIGGLAVTAIAFGFSSWFVSLALSVRFIALIVTLGDLINIGFIAFSAIAGFTAWLGTCAAVFICSYVHEQKWGLTVFGVFLAVITISMTANLISLNGFQFFFLVFAAIGLFFSAAAFSMGLEK